MAIGTTPLFSKISGSVGPVDYRTRRNGKIEIGKKRIPANPQSTEQQNTRNAYGRLHELWQNAAWIDKTQYENIAAAYDISAWNAFLMRHLPIMRLNPVAYWPFVEGTGNTLHDLTTNKIHGTISGATWEQLDKYDIPCLYFDGIDDFVDCGNGATLNFTDKITINVVPNPYAGQNYDNVNIIDKGSITAYRLQFEKVPKRLEFSIGNGVQQRFWSPNDAIVLDNPHYVSMTLHNGTLLGYINNVAAGSIPGVGPIAPTAQHFVIGAYYEMNNEYFKGQISELFLLNYSISTATNTHLYNTSKQFYGV